MSATTLPRWLRGQFGDTLQGSAGQETEAGGTGHDVMWGGAGHDVLSGGAGNDTIRGDDGNDGLGGGEGDDSLSGGTGHDLLSGGAGHDRVDGGGHQDTLRGEAGNDTLDGGAGNDLLEAGDGHDLVFGGRGHDFVWGGAGDDSVHGGDGADTARTGTGNDELYGNAGDDVLCPAGGDDLMSGGSGQDILWGGDGHDLGLGGYGNDLLTGGNGNDTLLGCKGEDFLLSRSDAGEPVIASAPGTPRVFDGMTLSGNDNLNGGRFRDADVFRFELLVNTRPEFAEKWQGAGGAIDWAGVLTETARPHDHWVDGIGHDRIVNFERGIDRIEIFGHRIEIASFEHVLRRPGVTDTVITLRAQEGGPFGGDQLGSITVLGVRLDRNEILLRDDVVIGAFDTLEFGQFPGDRFGTLPHGFTGLGDWVM